MAETPNVATVPTVARASTSNGMTSASALICHGWTLVLLGVASIVVGIFSSVFIYSLIIIGAPYWAGIFTLITGIIGVFGGKKAEIKGVTGCFLAMCIIALLATLIQWIISLSNLLFLSDTKSIAIHSILIVIGVAAMCTSFAGSIVSCCHLCNNNNQKPQQPMVVYVPTAPGGTPLQLTSTGTPGQTIQVITPNPNGPPGQMQIIQHSTTGYPQPNIITPQGAVGTYQPHQQFISQAPAYQPQLQQPGPYQPQQLPQAAAAPAPITPDPPPSYQESSPPPYTQHGSSSQNQEVYEELDQVRPSTYQALHTGVSETNLATQESSSRPSKPSNTTVVPRHSPQLPLSVTPPTLPPRNAESQEYYSDTVVCPETGDASSLNGDDADYLEPEPLNPTTYQSLQGSASQTTNQDYLEPSQVSLSAYQSLHS